MSPADSDRLAGVFQAPAPPPLAAQLADAPLPSLAQSQFRYLSAAHASNESSKSDIIPSSIALYIED